MQDALFSPHGYAYITAQIEAACANGSRTATVSGKWEIDEAVRIPSSFTLILDDCHLRMADGCCLTSARTEGCELQKEQGQRPKGEVLIGEITIL